MHDQTLAGFRELEASTPQQLATQIEGVEDSLRSVTTPPLNVAQLGTLEEAGYIQLALQPSWQASVLEQLSAPARAIAQMNLTAVADINTLNKPRDMLPSWRIEPPAPPAALLGYYQQAQQTYGVPWQYLAAINLVETNMGRIHGLSTAGAEGPMQFLPSTWAAYGQGGDVNNPADAIPAAARYLLKHGAPGDMQGALYAYDPTDLYVAAVSAYAQEMQSSMNALYGYYYWPVTVSLTDGYALLPEGFSN